MAKLEGEMQLGGTCRRCNVIVEITLNGRGVSGVDCIHLDQEWHQCISVEDTFKESWVGFKCG
jgi:hypothetical protein